MEEAKFTLYDLKTWPRAGHFKYYTEQLRCAYSMTVELEISHFLRRVRERGLRFYASFISLTARVVAEIPEMRMGLDEEGRPGHYSYMNPSYTIFHPEEGTFSDLWSQFDPDFDRLYANIVSDMERYKDSKAVKARPGQPPNFFCISCAPWISFTGYSTVNYGGAPNLFPLITYGRYREEGGKTLMPLALTIGHAAADGFHAARFFQALQGGLDRF